MIDNQLKSQLLITTSGFISREYVAETKEFIKDIYIASTPDNFIATYK